MRHCTTPVKTPARSTSAEYEAVYMTGFAARCNGRELAEDDSQPYTEGWLDADALAELAPLEWLRLEAER